MQEIKCFSLEKHTGPYEKWPRKTRLLKDSQPTGTSIPGYVIEAQYECVVGYLLITSQDCPFEESNDFILLNSSLRILHKTSLMVWYDSFLLEAHWPISATALTLHYYKTRIFTLEIEKRVFGFGYKLVLSRVAECDMNARDRKSIEELESRIAAVEEKAKERKKLDQGAHANEP